MTGFETENFDGFSDENFNVLSGSQNDIKHQNLSDINFDTRRKIENLLEERALKKLLDEGAYYDF
jgi:hypothetical protein